MINNKNLLPWHSVSGAGYKSEELRNGVQKIKNLRQEEEQHCFAKVAKNANYSKGHSRKITKCISHKHSAWIPAIQKLI